MGEMAIREWSWGMTTGSAMGGGRASRTALSELRIVRWVDAASTALMSVMRNNDVVKRAVLSVRKPSGGTPIDYFVVTIERGRITSYEVSSSGEPGMLAETLSVAFEKVEVQYQRQSSTGGKQAGSTFAADVGATR
jgi:type VI secretion system secreted protein Hcp